MKKLVYQHREGSRPSLAAMWYVEEEGREAFLLQKVHGVEGTYEQALPHRLNYEVVPQFVWDYLARGTPNFEARLGALAPYAVDDPFVAKGRPNRVAWEAWTGLPDFSLWLAYNDILFVVEPTPELIEGFVATVRKFLEGSL